MGHVTNDRLASGETPGGSALYAALTAAALGARVRVVTSFGPDFVGRTLLQDAGVDLQNAAAPHTTTFVNRYVGARREQRLLRRAVDLSAPVDDADVVFVCPVAGEVLPDVLAAPGRALLGASLQGWLRRFDVRGHVVPKRLDHTAFLAHCRAVFLSENDLGTENPDLLAALCAAVPIVVVTRGADGARLHAGGAWQTIDATPAREIDPTGAGDAFAAAFLVALARGCPLADCGRAGARAGALCVEGPGPAALVTAAGQPVMM